MTVARCAHVTPAVSGHHETAECRFIRCKRGAWRLCNKVDFVESTEAGGRLEQDKRSGRKAGSHRADEIGSTPGAACAILPTVSTRLDGLIGV